MKLGKFIEVISLLQKVHERSLSLYQKHQIDLFDYEDDFHKIISLLLGEVFNEDQKDWFEWFCYENDFGAKKLEATDKDGNLICQDIEGLYKVIYEK